VFTDIQRIDKIAKRDGLDLIVDEIQNLEMGLSPVIENTGGFHLWVAVYGDKGYLVANDEAVYFYTHNHQDGDEAEDLKFRDNDKEFHEHLPNDIWARQVAETFENYAHRVGKLRELVECPNHNGGYDCTPFCKICEGEQGYYLSEVGN
jgi:hypothetical protein